MSQKGKNLIEKGYNVDGKLRNLSKENWNFLIILDACRYDYFEKIYKKYINTDNLKKAVSPTTRTMAWLNIVFPGFYNDIVYISANPYINSKAEIIGQYGDKYEGKKHFYKIINVWDFGWDESISSVPPEEVNTAFFDAKKEYKDKRFILHYIQPHEPYISENYIKYIRREEKNIRAEAISKTRLGKIRVDPRKKTGGRDKESITFKKIIKSFIFKVFGRDTFRRIADHIVYRKIIKLFKGSPRTQISAIVLNEGCDGLKKAYKENLELVFKSVKEVINNIEGKILITSDHGEFLGEYGLYRHPDEPRKPENTETPWLEINKGGRQRIEEPQKISRDIDEAINILKGLKNFN